MIKKERTPKELASNIEQLITMVNNKFKINKIVKKYNINSGDIVRKLV